MSKANLYIHTQLTVVATSYVVRSTIGYRSNSGASWYLLVFAR